MEAETEPAFKNSAQEMKEETSTILHPDSELEMLSARAIRKAQIVRYFFGLCYIRTKLFGLCFERT